MKEEFKHVLEKTVALFMRYGIKAVSMDDVAREVGMSKKTIYQHFTDRSTLVDEAVKLHIEMINDACSAICNNDHNPIDQILEIGKFMHNTTRQMNPNLFYDLKKYFPSSWSKVTSHREENMRTQVIKNLERGIELGYYRDDFNPGIVARLYMNLIDVIIDDDLFPKIEYTFKELHHELLMYHLHGIVTPKGTEYLHQKQQNDV